MKFLTSKPGYAHVTYWVELSEDDKKRSNRVLITMADDRMESVTDAQAEAINKPGMGAVRHFGGSVYRDGDKATIKVHTD